MILSSIYNKLILDLIITVKMKLSSVNDEQIYRKNKKIILFKV